jgi:murein DD-endopeptidase MepM/ murein hydrolase activator NlpD
MPRLVFHLHVIVVLVVLFVSSIQSVRLFAYEADFDAIPSDMFPKERVDLLKRTFSAPLTNPQQTKLSKLSFGDESWRLPYIANSRVYQDQGYNGQFSHQGTFALDMRSPNSQTVAARNGVIASINFGGKWDSWCNSNADCANKGGVWRGNHILINHNDGSTSYYLHMRPGSLAPNIWVGKYVDQGTPLGVEGYTGYTCLDLNVPCNTPDPHMHFQVNQNGKSVPTYFDDCNYLANQCINGTPIEGRTNTSTNFPADYQVNTRTSKINYFGTNKAVSFINNQRGNTLELGYENERPTSRLEWLQNGEIKTVNEWCLSGEGGNIVLRDCNGGNGQKWVRGANNSIRNVESGLCWDSYSGDVYRSRVYLWQCHGGSNQRWRVGNEPYGAGNS